MKKPSLILRLSAFLLIIIFSQKAGVGLFVHNLIHKTFDNTQSQEKGKVNDVYYNCSCIDDFLVPYTDAEEAIIPQPSLLFIHSYTFFEENISYRSPVYLSLRGPPSVLS